MVAPGGVGKTALRLAQLLSLAVGRSLTGEYVFKRCRVLIVSLEDDRDEVELWVELSTDEQLYRLGRQLAQRISAGLRPDGDGPNVWVMYRVVPLSHAFLNGEARGRGTAGLE